ncbi:hypothetical protein vseg_009381 [Gypsophila vaccaria]
MLNTNNSASKKHQISRTPLKLKDTNGNVASSSPPKGCLSFFLSNHSFTSKNGNNSQSKCGMVDKTPNSSPHFRVLKENVEKKLSNFPNLVNFRSKNVKKNPHLMKSEEGFGSKYDLSDGVNKFTSGFQFKLCDASLDVVNVRKTGSSYDLSDDIVETTSGFEFGLSDDAVNVRKDGSKCGSCTGNVDEFAAVDNLGRGCGSVSFSGSDNADKSVGDDPALPAVQVSDLPEIRVGLASVVGATPDSCYAAGDVSNGVTDKWECSRDKGTVVNGSEGVSVVGELNNPRESRDCMVCAPTEASICWLSTGRAEKNSDSCDDDEADSYADGSRLCECERLLPFEVVEVSTSPSSGRGVSCTFSASDTSFATPNSRRSNFALYSDLSSEFRSLFGPSIDRLVSSPSSPSFVGSPTSKVEFLPKEGKSQYGHERRDSHSLEDSSESGNVMQTPATNSSLSNIRHSCQSLDPNSMSPNFSLSGLSRDQISRLWFECELDSVTELLRDCQITELDSSRASSNFNPLIELDNSANSTLFGESTDRQISDISESLRHRLPDPEARIVWREGLASRMLEMGELDCCRYLSDNEDIVTGNCDASECCSSLQIAATLFDKLIDDSYNPTTLLQPADIISRNRGKSPLLKGTEPCLKAADDDGRYELVPKGSSSWTVCYRNNLFQV